MALPIKTLTIHGFKAFRDKQVIKDFSPKHNVFIGRNGAGKTTIFDAISFVLSDSHSNLTRKKRQELLHNGGGHRAMTAYVELVFDNSAGRLQSDTSDVVLRRTIGMKKDEYFLNRKRLPRADVLNMLESAGFSRSNPYYIVQQNQTEQLATMSDAARLQVLKEVAGTRVYDERRAESVKILRETDSKLAKIEEVIHNIEERISELDEEKAELGAFLTLDRKRRALEYLIAKNRLEKAREMLERYADHQNDGAAEGNKVRARMAELHAELQLHKKAVDEAKANIAKAETDEREYRKRHTELLATRSKLQLVVKRLQASVRKDQTDAQARELELEQVQDKISAAQKQLATEAEPALVDRQAEFDELAQKYAQARQDQQALFAKQGRQRLYKSKRDRDAYLGQEIKACDRNIQTLAGVLAQNEHNADSLTRELKAMKRVIAAKDKQCRKLLEKQDAETVTGLTNKRKSLLQREKEAQRELDEVEGKMNTLNSSFQDARRRFDQTKSRAVRDGLAAVREYVNSKGLEGVHGPLIELFGLDRASVMAAVEVTANNQLFHVVVDNDAIAAELVEFLEKDRRGRVTFIPLNRCKKPGPAPSVDKNQAIPLISTLKYGDTFAGVMDQVFGKTLLCRDQDVATKLSSSLNVDCVTLEGDQISRHGALRGGYVDQSTSRLQSFADMSQAMSQREDLDESKEKLEKDVMRLSQELTAVTGDLQKADSVRREARASYKRLQHELTQTQERLRTKEDTLKQLERKVLEARAEHTLQRNTRTTLEGELQSPFTSKLSSQEQRMLDELNTTVESLQARKAAAGVALATAKSAQSALHALLNDNLLRVEAELKQSLSVDAGGVGNMDAAARAEELQAKEEELGQLQLAEESASEEAASASARLRSEFEPALTAATERVREVEGQIEAVTDEMEAKAKDMEKWITKAKLAEHKKEDAMRTIRELGTIPAAEVSNLSTTSSTNLHTKLQGVNKKLQKFSHVNKKAKDQFASFSEQRTNLESRKQELDEGKASIQKLITNLDMKKNEAIIRTFRQVALGFAQVFKELVPEGTAKLQMRTRGDGDDESKQDVDNFVGVSMKAFFGAGREEARSFSGGQMTMISLAFICAIQRCDPAPFYVFDEVDRALDPEAAKRVGALLVKQTESGAQVFTISHNANVVATSNKCFGLSFQNKQSSVHLQTRDEAMSFVSRMNAEEAPVARQGQSKRRRRQSSPDSRGEDSDTSHGERTDGDEGSDVGM